MRIAIGSWVSVLLLGCGASRAGAPPESAPVVEPAPVAPSETASSSEAAPPPALVRFVHAEARAARAGVTVDGETLLADLAPGDATSMRVELAPGAHVFDAPGVTQQRSDMEPWREMTLEAGRSYVAVIFGGTNHTLAWSADPAVATEPGASGLRFFNASAGVAADLCVRAGEAAPRALENVARGTWSGTAIAIAALEVELELRSTRGVTASTPCEGEIRGTAEALLAPATHYALVALDDQLVICPGAPSEGECDRLPLQPPPSTRAARR